MNFPRLTAIVAAASLAWPAAAATFVDVQFTGATAQTGAAVTGTSGDTWNVFGQANGSNAALATTSGAASGLTLSWSASGLYTAGASSTAFANTAYANLMRGYLYSGNSIALTLSGLAAGQNYSLYLYTQGDNGTNGRVNNLSVNGASASNANTNIGQFVQGNNYALFTGTASQNGTITISDVKGNGEANLNGFQLVAGDVPEPATWATMIAGFGLIGAVLRRGRRTMARAA